MADKNFVTTPAECMEEPKTKGGPGTYDGEKGHGLEGRTKSPNAVPEKIYEDHDAGGVKMGTGTFVSTPAKPPFGDKK